MKYSIVIPVYKSVESLEIIAEQVYALQKELKCNFELIFVNDSPFFIDTVNTLKELSAKYNNINVLNLRKNQGQHMAILIGIAKSTGDYVITMDDDLQHPVNEIPKLISTLENNKDIEVAFAIPGYDKKKHSIWRNWASLMLNTIDTYFLKKPKGLIKSPFRIMTADIAKLIVNNYNAMPSVSSLLINSTDSIINVKVSHNKREFGKSNYTLPKMISLSLNNIIHYSSLPLKVVGMIGFFGFLFSLLFILYVTIERIFFGLSFPGYFSTVSLISFFGGINLLGIGVVGEYLIRIIKEQQKTPLNDYLKN